MAHEGMIETVAREALLVFVRFPQPGRVKTRLIPALGAAGAADVYRDIADQALQLAGEIPRPTLTRRVFVEPAESVKETSAWVGDRFEVFAQIEGDLGVRMEAAIRHSFERGAERVVIIGSDCPGLQQHHILEAFDALSVHDAVIGPALDGGYYLLGLARSLPAAFRDVPWSSPTTRQITLHRLEQQRCWVYQLESLRDLDTPQDLAELQHLLRQPKGHRTRPERAESGPMSKEPPAPV